MELIQRISFIFQFEDVLWGFAPATRVSPYRDNAVVPNLKKILNFLDQSVISCGISYA